MTWVWSSYEEFKKLVSPIYLDTPGSYDITRSNSWFENVEQMLIARDDFIEQLNELRRMGLYKKPPYQNKAAFSSAREVMWQLVHHGELLLIYHKRLASSRWARNFIDAKNLDAHWDRFVKEANERIYYELYDLYWAGEKLAEGFQSFANEDKNFLIENLENIWRRKDLMSDFVLARNLFSIGIEGVGTFVAGRGLEGILREVAKRKGIVMLVDGGKTEHLASEVSFHDLIEVFYRTRWKNGQRRLIDEPTKKLLHFLRSMRNYSAHPSGSEKSEDHDWRSLATIISKSANSIWGDAQRERAQLVMKKIPKDWKPE